MGKIEFGIAVCDDDGKVCSEIEKYALEYAEKNAKHMIVETYYSGTALCEDLAKGLGYDLIFLDIELKDLSGIQVGLFIRDKLQNEALQLVYISSYTKYALELFQVRPMDFLQKPVTKKKIFNAIHTAIRLTQKGEKIFYYKQGRNQNRIYVKDIIYFKSKDKEVELFSTHGKTSFYKSLEEIYEELQDQGFFFAHRSYLVHYMHVRQFYYDRLVMSDGEIINIGQTRRKEVREIQKWYMAEEREDAGD